MQGEKTTCLLQLQQSLLLVQITAPNRSKRLLSRNKHNIYDHTHKAYNK
jgi:hypothetical protein